MSKFESILWEERSGVAYIILNQPDKGNIINESIACEIVEACRLVREGEAIRCAVIKGTGADFCAGADIAGVRKGKSGLHVAREILKLECPSIAVIKGKAFGQGLEIALACDIRLASKEATFAMTHIYQGRLPDDGATQLLPRITGKARAIEMLITGEPIDAEEAYRVGIVSHILPVSDMDAEAIRLAEQIAVRAPVATRFAKEAVLKGLDLTLDQGLRLETDLYMMIHTTKDRTEGIRSFLEKHQPHFEGR